MSNTDLKTMKTKIEAQQKKKFAKEAIESAKTGGFREFIEKQGVLSLAVGLVLGTAATSLINSMMNNVVLPPLGFILGSAEGLKGLSVNLGTTPDGKTAVLNYGVFLNDLINFLVIAVVIYWMVKLFTKAMKKQEEISLLAKQIAEEKSAEALTRAEMKKVEKRALKKEASIKKMEEEGNIASVQNVESFKMEDGRKK